MRDVPRAVRDGCGLRVSPDGYRSLRSELFKFIEWDGGHRELYVLPSDPWEIRNLQEVADRLGGLPGRSRVSR